MSSEVKEPRSLFVWAWLPGRAEPVVAGRLYRGRDGRVAFLYGTSYRGRSDAVPLWLPELPLREGEIRPGSDLPIASCIRDAAPDAWGRRVIINRLTGRKIDSGAAIDLGEMTYLRESGSDRIGALDFQDSSSVYVPRESENAPIEELLEAAERVDRGVPLTPELERALLHGTTIGGARPKAMVVDGGKKLIAKFSATTDDYPVVKAEFALMRLASLVGLRVAPVRMIRAAQKDVLLVERFDRVVTNEGGARRMMVSSLTIQGISEGDAPYVASYEVLAEIMRQRFVRPVEATRELFRRIVMNVLGGNTDDHARNHSAFWDGSMLELTPAYDLCPLLRKGGEARQAMAIVGDDRRARIRTCLDAAGIYGLTRSEAVAEVEACLTVIRNGWASVAAEAGLTEVERRTLAGQALLHPSVFYGLDGPEESLAKLGTDILERMRAA